MSETFSNSISLAVSNEWKRCCDSDFNSGFSRLPRCLSKGCLKRGFLEIYLTTFPEFVISEIQNLWGSSFVLQYLKLIVDFKNLAKNSENIFCFWDNCIWIGIIKFSLLRTGYFSSAANCYQAFPECGLSITETFSNSTDLAVINQYSKNVLMKISTLLWHVYHVACWRVVWNEPFKTFIWPHFWSL